MVSKVKHSIFSRVPQLGQIKNKSSIKNKLRSLLSHNLPQQDLGTHSYSWAELKSCSAGPISPFSTAVGFKNSKSRFRISPPWLSDLLTTTSDSKFRQQRHSWHKWAHNQKIQCCSSQVALARRAGIYQRSSFAALLFISFAARATSVSFPTFSSSFSSTSYHFSESLLVPFGSSGAFVTSCDSGAFSNLGNFLSLLISSFLCLLLSCATLAMALKGPTIQFRGVL